MKGVPISANDSWGRGPEVVRWLRANQVDPYRTVEVFVGRNTLGVQQWALDPEDGKPYPDENGDVALAPFFTVPLREPLPATVHTDQDGMTRLTWR